MIMTSMLFGDPRQLSASVFISVHRIFHVGRHNTYNAMDSICLHLGATIMSETLEILPIAEIIRPFNVIFGVSDLQLKFRIKISYWAPQ